MKKLAKFLSLQLTFTVFWVLAVFKGHYRARQIIYKSAQDESSAFWGPVFRLFLESPLASVCVDYQYGRLHKQNERMAPGAALKYGQADTNSYSQYEYKHGGSDIRTQQRGLLLPLLEKQLAEFEGGPSRTFVELGTGNGDVSAYLAERHPHHRFIGIDFTVEVPVAKHLSKPGVNTNLSFRAGYALDLLEGNTLKGDVIFMSSTCLFFAPKEFANYLKAIRPRFSYIVLSEPVFSGYRMSERDTRPESKHLEGITWFHNYPAYLNHLEFKIRDFKYFHYKHPKSVRPDIYVALVRASSR